MDPRRRHVCSPRPTSHSKEAVAACSMAVASSTAVSLLNALKKPWGAAQSCANARLVAAVSAMLAQGLLAVVIIHARTKHQAHKSTSREVLVILDDGSGGKGCATCVRSGACKHQGRIRQTPAFVITGATWKEQFRHLDRSLFGLHSNFKTFRTEWRCLLAPAQSLFAGLLSELGLHHCRCRLCRCARRVGHRAEDRIRACSLGLYKGHSGAGRKSRQSSRSLEAGNLSLFCRGRR